MINIDFTEQVVEVETDGSDEALVYFVTASSGVPPEDYVQHVGRHLPFEMSSHTTALGGRDHHVRFFSSNDEGTFRVASSYRGGPLRLFDIELRRTSPDAVYVEVHGRNNVASLWLVNGEHHRLRAHPAGAVVFTVTCQPASGFIDPALVEQRLANRHSINQLFEPSFSASVEDVSMDEPLPMALPKERNDIKCADCGGNMRLRTSQRFKPFYGCTNYPDCKGTHSAHSDGSPMGVPGDQRTRAARKKAHQLIDEVWRKNILTRMQVYSWMRDTMKLSDRETHIGFFTEEMCNLLIERARAHFPCLRTAWDRLREDPFEDLSCSQMDDVVEASASQDASE